MTQPSHRIRRQRWLVRASSSTEAFAVRRRLREEWEAVLLPAFEAAFNVLAPGDDVVRIPKIELRLKVAPGEHFPQHLAELIRLQLGERLSELENDPMAKRETALKRSSARRHRFEALLCYLRTGSVPWESTETNPCALAAEMAEICREHQAELRSLLLNDHGTSAYYFRLLQLIPATQSVAMVRSLTELIPFEWRKPLAELLVALLELGEGRFGRHVQLELTSEILSFALSHLETPEPMSLQTLMEQRSADAGRRATWTELLAFFPAAAELEPEGPSAEQADRQDQSVGAALGTFHGDALKTLPVKFPGDLPPDATLELDRFPSAPDADFPMLVDSAGLVLLHPFLARFFETRGLKQPGLPELSSLPHIAALLHLLATGRETVFEYELPFIKVLLGLASESPLCVAEGLITTSDREESEALVQAAILHWTALKNTSVSGFRSSFLSRPGLLYDTPDGWRLQVERAGFDVLLDQLPWGISVVKLPWMKRPLHTEW